MINSTVAPGTTRRIAAESGAAVVNSPVRGKHARMQDEMLRYTKFIGALDAHSGQRAVEHFEQAGMKTKLLGSPEATEIAKLSETTYFGLLIAWAQEVGRYCGKLGTDYDEVVSFYDEIEVLSTCEIFSRCNWWSLRDAQHRRSYFSNFLRAFAGYRAIRTSLRRRS